MFSEGNRDIFLSQMSGCAVERVFSQLKLIRDACGDNLMEDTLDTRMFERCIGKLNKICDSDHN